MAGCNYGNYRAYYGIPPSRNVDNDPNQGFIDVSMITYFLGQQYTSITVSNSTFLSGDPAPGYVKTFVCTWVDDGAGIGNGSAIVTEGSTFVFPPFCFYSSTSSSSTTTTG